MPAMEADAFEAGAPGIEMGGGEFFSQELGTLLRMRYNTESYGQERRGNLDLGTMRVANFQDAIAFFDGQVTLSDVNGVGYNLGVGFRWLGWTPFPLEPERITGFSFWADGSSTESGNFFPQVGVSYESLGDMWDLRVNGYIPVGKESQIGEFTPTGAVSFDENFLVQEAIADRNTSFNVGEAEIARRIMGDRDAWAFAGSLRAGERRSGHGRLPRRHARLRVSGLAAANRGDRRRHFQDERGVPGDVVRRPDAEQLPAGVRAGGPDARAGDAQRLRRVAADDRSWRRAAHGHQTAIRSDSCTSNSDAPDGGNGTFENPLNDVGNVEPNSQDSDIVLLYSDSMFNSQNTLVLQDNQRLLGEGNGEFFTINTLQQGDGRDSRDVARGAGRRAADHHGSAGTRGGAAGRHERSGQLRHRRHGQRGERGGHLLAGYRRGQSEHSRHRHARRDGHRHPVYAAHAAERRRIRRCRPWPAT